LTEWGTKLKAAEMWEAIEEFSLASEEFQAVRDEDTKKFTLTKDKMVIKVKFFECEEEGTLKISFIKKQGDLMDFYKLLKIMRTDLDDNLVSRVVVAKEAAA
jgi:hypothetical protein